MTHLAQDYPKMAAALDAACADHMRVRRLAAGQRLFRADAPVRSFFVIRLGRVRLLRHATDGVETTLHVANAVSCIAEASLFADRYHCDAVADSASTIAAFPKDTILEALRSDDQLGQLFMATMARQVQALRGHIELLNERSASARVLMYLRSMSADVSGKITLHEPWKSAATQLGLTHEAVYRALRALEDDGRIERLDGRTVRLPP